MMNFLGMTLVTMWTLIFMCVGGHGIIEDIYGYVDGTPWSINIFDYLCVCWLFVYGWAKSNIGFNDAMDSMK